MKQYFHLPVYPLIELYPAQRVSFDVLFAPDLYYRMIPFEGMSVWYNNKACNMLQNS